MMPAYVSMLIIITTGMKAESNDCTTLETYAVLAPPEGLRHEDFRCN